MTFGYLRGILNKNAVVHIRVHNDYSRDLDYDTGSQRVRGYDYWADRFEDYIAYHKNAGEGIMYVPHRFDNYTVDCIERYDRIEKGAFPIIHLS